VSDEDQDHTSGAIAGAAWVTRFSTGSGGKPPANVDIDDQQADINLETAPSSTADCGQDVDDADDDESPPPPGDLAQSALADARKIARTTPRRSRDAARRTRRENLAGRNRGGYSTPGPDPTRDPQRLGSLLSGYVEERGWDRPLAEARVFAEWSALVGPDVAAHCEPQSLRDGELRIAAESTAWATQLRMLTGTLLARLIAELGPDIVAKLIITGPVGPSWKHGGRSVRGARGPRDTYG
jgi:predicted nucleic acid-binding Zn ribbon protein